MINTLETYLKQAIVVDTDSPWLYIGVLEKVTAHCLVLSGVDAHDSSDTSTSKELYILESKQTGIKSNRQHVSVMMGRVVSCSLLEDIKEF